MPQTNSVNWLEKVKKKFSHPAIILWRAVELREISRILTQYSLKQPILDLGCAEGNIAELLFKEKSLIGLDNCWELISKNTRQGIYLGRVLGDACRMPYKNEVFGSVFSNCVIEHIAGLDSVLNEVSRVLKPQGLLLFTVPSHKFADFLFFSTIFKNLGLKSLACWYKTKRNKLLNHFHCYDHSRWRDILKKKGLDLIQYNYYMPKKATFIWDLLAALIFILGHIRLLNRLLPKINNWISNHLEPYYDINCEIGGGLLLVAQKL